MLFAFINHVAIFAFKRAKMAINDAGPNSENGTTYENAAENLSQNGSLWWLVNIQIFAQDQDESGNNHEKSRNSKGQRIASVISKTMDLLPSIRRYKKWL